MHLSEALAQIRFSEMVEKKDILEAFRLLEVAVQQFVTVPANVKQHKDNICWC